MGKMVNLKGLKFGKLTVLYMTDRKSKGGSLIWHCKCDCGREVDVRSGNLQSGNTKSCGCTGSPDIAGIQNAVTVLGSNFNFRKDRLYRIWHNIKSRCTNPNIPAYKYYGGRGIKVCDEWSNDYWEFRNWAVKHGYGDRLTIDRIDVDGNYQPDNCRWVTQQEQNYNKRGTIYVHFKGKRISLKKMSVELGLDYMRIYDYMRGKYSEC